MEDWCFKVSRLGLYLFSKTCLIWLWHSLLGDPSFWLLKKVFPSLSENINCLDFHWEVCVLAKHHLYSFLVKNPKRLSPFCLMHSDVWGSSRVTNNLNFWWYIIFIEDCTCSTCVYLLKSKSEVSTIFPISHKFMSTQLGVKICALKSDNRKKYFNNDLIAWLHNPSHFSLLYLVASLQLKNLTSMASADVGQNVSLHEVPILFPWFQMFMHNQSLFLLFLRVCWIFIEIYW